MKFEIRPPAGDCTAPLALAIQGGDIVPGQVSTHLEYHSGVGELSCMTITFALGLDIPLTAGAPLPRPPQDLQACAHLFAQLSPANRLRFVTMHAEALGQMATPGFVIAEVASLDAQVVAVDRALRRIEADAQAAMRRRERTGLWPADDLLAKQSAAKAVRTALVEAGGPKP